MDRLCSARPEKSPPGLHLMFTNTTFPASKGTHDLLTLYIPPLTQFYFNSHLMKPFIVSLSYKDPEGTLQCFFLFLSYFTPQCKTNTYSDDFWVEKHMTIIYFVLDEMVVKQLGKKFI